jgi:uncharacterized protein
MVIPDVNVLLYAINSAAPHHPASRRWLEGALNGDETVGFDWVVILGFVRISTHPSILPHPLASSAAWDIVDGWLARPVSEVIRADATHAARLRQFTLRQGGNLVTDAHLAALAVAYGARVCSFDRDFERFESVVRLEPTET